MFADASKAFIPAIRDLRCQEILPQWAYSYPPFSLLISVSENLVIIMIIVCSLWLLISLLCHYR